MRILLTGRTGQVGGYLADLLPACGELVALDRSQLDLLDRTAIVRIVRDLKPEVIINPAAYTAVDKAESDAAAAHALNALAPEVLAEEAKRLQAVLIHYSTDYVFDGTANEAYSEDSPVNPQNVYGRSKLAGEQAIQAVGRHWLILRTSWVYGLTGKNFLLTMQRLARERPELQVVNDQIGVPNWSFALAQTTVTLLNRGLADLREHSGLYHLSCRGQTNWHDFARAILGEAVRLVPITTKDYPLPAKRPAYAVLSTTKIAKTFGLELPFWQDCLRDCLRGGSELAN